ncbi:MAG: hypothetical protein EOP13_01210 [Pseudomonas sp.]|uniref:hypothetical protein n=1 Tax=Pseudomonas sp. TaxID=306 RepID=UPI0012231F32|nr:hypothetical protein [Pseudomonas sp.]RZI76711.1 MAG: hypothetical protein EOP13_01210 [Pseudomonas sp.]
MAYTAPRSANWCAHFYLARIWEDTVNGGIPFFRVITVAAKADIAAYQKRHALSHSAARSSNGSIRQLRPVLASLFHPRAMSTWRSRLLLRVSGPLSPEYLFNGMEHGARATIAPSRAPGLHYEPNFIDAREEGALIARTDASDLSRVAAAAVIVPRAHSIAAAKEPARPRCG